MTHISPERRKRAATVHTEGKAKFPVDSKKTAQSAEKLINTAKPPLSPSQKAAIHRKSARFGVQPNMNPDPDAK